MKMETNTRKDESEYSHIEILVGDSRSLLPQINSQSVQCCVTSPPYWGLRDYQHPSQIGN